MGYKHFKKSVLFMVTKGGSSSTVAYIASTLGILKGGSTTVLLTSCVTGLELAV